MNETIQYLIKILKYHPTQCIIQAKPYPSITKKYMKNVIDNLKNLSKLDKIAKINKILDIIEKGEISI